MNPFKSLKEQQFKGKGKQQKHFLQQKEAVSLAVSIADDLAVKSQAKVKRHQLPRLGDRAEGTSDRKIPKAKDRIKEKKAVLLAQKMKSKKEKTKQRKLEAAPSDNTTSAEAKLISHALRKRVTFA